MNFCGNENAEVDVRHEHWSDDKRKYRREMHWILGRFKLSSNVPGRVQITLIWFAIRTEQRQNGRLSLEVSGIRNVEKGRQTEEILITFVAISIISLIRSMTKLWAKEKINETFNS